MKIMNPLGEDTSIMRTTVLPSMLEILSRNYNYRNQAVRLYELGRVEELSPQLKETVILRETYPELTLSQLAEEFDPPVTKSCLSHRLKKIMTFEPKE